MKGLRVPKNKGEEVRKKLLEFDFLNKKFEIEKNNDFLIFPLKELKEEPSIIREHEVVEFEPSKIERSPRNYKEVLKSDSDLKIPESLWDELPSSYDLIGDIAVMDVHDNLKDYEKFIGEALLRAHSNIKTVLSQKSPVSGEFRVRGLKVIAGEKRTETIHREHGIELKLDLDDVYFTPRLSTERWRVTKMANGAENVIDMFAGVGPFSIMIAKHNSDDSNLKRVEAIEINSKAFSYLVDNIKRNNVRNIVNPHEGDAGEIMENLESSDRIIMNLPWKSDEFLDLALTKINDDGVIHYYTFTDDVNNSKKDIENKVRDLNLDIEIEFLNTIKLRSYSKNIDNFVFDLKVS